MSAQLGDPEQALAHRQQSLALEQDLGDRRGEALTLDSIGYAHHLLCHHEQAIAYYQQSVALREELGAAEFGHAWLPGLAAPRSGGKSNK